MKKKLTDKFDAVVGLDELLGEKSGPKCSRCGKGIPTAIYRLSPKGGPFLGSCRPCLTPEEWANVSPEVKQITEILDNPRKS